MTTKDTAQPLRFNANPRMVSAAGTRVEPYAGPVAILVDSLTGSASECFAGGMQSLGRARVFGQTSMGQDPTGEGDVFPRGALGLGQRVPGRHDAPVGCGSNWGSSLARSSCTVVLLAMPSRQARRALGQFTMAAPRTVLPSVV